MNLGKATILRADARKLPLADDSVDLVVTSPPYFALRSYQDGGEHYEGQIGAEATPREFVEALLEVTRECVRVLKPTGSLWVNLGDKYATSVGQGNGIPGATSSLSGRDRLVRAYDVTDGRRTNQSTGGVRAKSLLGVPWRYAIACIDELGLILRAELIWSKPNALPESVKDRVRRTHEQWFHFTLRPNYYSTVDEIREEHSGPWKSPGGARPAAAVGPQARGGHSQHERTREEREATVRHEAGRLPSSVWSVASEPLTVPKDLGVDHFAAFPTEWPKRLIQAWSPPDGIVLDPFGGTGTTAMVAKALGRHGISVDMSADYCRLAEWRTNDRDQLAKVLGVAKAEQQPADQLSIFDMDGVA